MMIICFVLRCRSVCRYAVTFFNIVLFMGLATTSSIAAEILPHSTTAYGDNSISKAWFTEPTNRYPHAVLGDNLEAGALNIKLNDGSSHTFRISDDSVFEDLVPRIADINQDGFDEVWVVRADREQGARLEAYGMQGVRFTRMYSTVPIGRGFRWLNPVGIADFNGDGNLEAAYVQTPHIGGILKIVHLQNEKLSLLEKRSGYSTHAIGSIHLDLSAIADLDNDGAAEIILPDQFHRELVALSLQGGTLVERWRAPIERIKHKLQIHKSNDGFYATYVDHNEILQKIVIPEL